MISRLSEKAVDYFIHKEAILLEDRGLYIYGFFLLFSQVIFFILTALYGLLFSIPLESILFYIMFTVIRSYAGGFHASKESMCTVSSSIALFLSVYTIKLLVKVSPLVAPLLSSVISLILIEIIAPLDSEAKQLTEQERKEYKKKSLITGIGIACIGIIMIRIRISIFYACAVSLVLESFLLVLGKHCSI